MVDSLLFAQLLSVSSSAHKELARKRRRDRKIASFPSSFMEEMSVFSLFSVLGYINQKWPFLSEEHCHADGMWERRSLSTTEDIPVVCKS
jgi:hypothetical protein